MSEVEAIAAAIHETWRALSRKEGLPMRPNLDQPYVDLADADKDNNRAAARRMGDVLAVAGLTLSNDPARQAVASDALTASMEALAEAEHDGWMAQRARNGWSWGETRDDEAKRHPSMVPYARLPESEKDKDRGNVRRYPDFAAGAGYRIVRSR